jgi:trehalose synthase-fused probable maltokinase
VSTTIERYLAPAPESRELGEWMLRQRWFGAKARELGEVSILDAVALPDGSEAPILLLLAEVLAPAGTHELYQLPVGLAEADGDGARPAEWIAAGGGRMLYDALAGPTHVARLATLIDEQATVSDGATTVRFQRAGELELPQVPSVRPVGAEQSNSSVVVDDRFVLKVFRHLEAGINPELEVLSFLADHDFPHIAPIAGWYSYEGELLDATLGLLQAYVADATDGWALVVAALENGIADDVLDPLGELGAVTGRMHAALASESEDPAFAPEDPADEHVALLTATIDEQIERLFLQLPERPALEPIAGRGEELRDRLSLLSHTGLGGRLIRSHGDYHLGQTMLAPAGWVVLDFEGEPRRPLPERRRKRSPLRDVAGMLRSISYAGLAGELLHQRASAPPGWEERARESFLSRYLAEVDPALLPAGAQAIEKQLAIFELEKVLYELNYELENRPDWLVVPVSAIERLLEEPLQ